jgi:hypothetical protein
MIRSLLVLCLVLLCAAAAEAAPRWRRTNNTTYYSAPTTTSSMPKVASYAASSMPAHSDTGSAQGVAEMMASRGVMQHFGGNSGYEGVGMGSTPEQALNNCCFSNAGMAVVDQGVACGSNGKWYACKRYR